MASRYHWLTASVDTQFNLGLPTAQAPAISLPAGATMKRFMVRKTFYQANNNGTGGNNSYDVGIRWQVAFTAGPNNGRVIYSTDRRVPFVSTIFVPIAGSNTYCWWGAGDNELGFNERCSYGLASGAAAAVQATYSAVPTRFAVHSNLFGEFGYQFAVLYYL